MQAVTLMTAIMASITCTCNAHYFFSKKFFFASTLLNKGPITATTRFSTPSSRIRSSSHTAFLSTRSRIGLSSSSTIKKNHHQLLKAASTVNSSPKKSLSLKSQVQDDPIQLHKNKEPPLKINLLTIQQPELENLLKSWNQPKYRAKQILHWVREMGVSEIDEMENIPKKLRHILKEYTSIGTLGLEVEVISKDGTRKRAYRLWDGQLIESVLMPYEDGRQTACISSQAGCAMGCVFCATGQMGFARQLTQDEIFEQVARFAAELKGENKRLSNVVMMGMGEPLANYRNVLAAIRRMNSELGIGARKITVSTVGVVPNIKKLMEEDIQVRLALSLHCANDEERTALLPANKRYGGLDELMETIREYIYTTNRRVTLEWALIENENDTPEVARELGQLLRRFEIRRDMIHINVIPLNPTGGFEGSPSGRSGVHAFVSTLDKEFGLKATPRVRRGIDIDAGCGQLKATVKKREEKEAKAAQAVAELKHFIEEDQVVKQNPIVGVYEDEENDEDDLLNLNDEDDLLNLFSDQISRSNQLQQGSVVNFELHDTVDLDTQGNDFEDELYENELDKNEAARLIKLVKMSSPQPDILPKEESILSGPTTSIVDDDSVREAKKRRKKLLKLLKQIKKLKELQKKGTTLNEEQKEKISREEEWKFELESVEHNLQ